MAIVQYMASGQITQITGYNYIAELQYGSNGEMYGQPELDAGTATSRVIDLAQWDSNPEDGMDTGWLGSGFTLGIGSLGMSWATVVSSQRLTYNVGGLSSIGSVKLRAGVQNQAAMLWRDVWFSFYRDGTLSERVNVAGLGPDKSQVYGGATAEQVVEVRPSSPADRVDVSGEFKMIAPPDVYLDSYDVFSQIMVFAGSGSGSGMNSMLTGSPTSLLGAKSMGILGAEPLTSASTGGKYNGYTFAITPASSATNDALLDTEAVPDLYGGVDAGLLA